MLRSRRVTVGAASATVTVVFFGIATLGAYLTGEFWLVLVGLLGAAAVIVLTHAALFVAITATVAQQMLSPRVRLLRTRHALVAIRQSADGWRWSLNGHGGRRRGQGAALRAALLTSLPEIAGNGIKLRMRASAAKVFQLYEAEVLDLGFALVDDSSDIPITTSWRGWKVLVPIASVAGMLRIRAMPQMSDVALFRAAPADDRLAVLNELRRIVGSPAAAAPASLTAVSFLLAAVAVIAALIGPLPTSLAGNTTSATPEVAPAVIIVIVITVAGSLLLGSLPYLTELVTTHGRTEQAAVWLQAYENPPATGWRKLLRAPRSP